MAGKLTINQIQLGDHATPANNFVLQTNADGTAKLARGNAGATTQDILTVDASGNVDVPLNLTRGSVQTLRMVTTSAQATTSGSAIDFSAIPSWAKRVTVMWKGLSTSTTTQVGIQIGPSGGVETTGYSGTTQDNSGTVTSAVWPSNFIAMMSGVIAAANTHSGKITLTLENAASNTWIVEGYCLIDGTVRPWQIQGYKALAGALSVVRLMNATFDAGEASVIYEG